MARDDDEDDLMTPDVTEKKDDDESSVVQDVVDGTKNAVDDVKELKDKIDDIKDLVNKIQNGEKIQTDLGPNATPTKDGGATGTKPQTTETTSGSNGTGNGPSAESGTTTTSSTSPTSTNMSNPPKPIDTSGASNTAANTAANTAGETAANTAANTSAAATETAAAEGAGAAAGGAGAAAGGAAAVPIGVVILIIILVILIILGIIGTVSFFNEGMGLITGKFTQFGKSIWKNWVAYLYGDAIANVDEDNIIEIAEYLETMGYDLEGYGFLNSKGKYVSEEKSESSIVYKNSDGDVILEREIDENGTEGSIKHIKSSSIWAYLVSENRIYLEYKENSFKSPLQLLASLFKSSEMSDADGLIKFDYTGLDDEKPQIEIDSENKKMIITYAGNVYSYDMDGWTGRYGKSLEFLLTLHLATMAPQFAQNVALNKIFDTFVTVGFKPVDVKINVLYKTGENEEGNDTFTDIEESNWESLGITDTQWELIKQYKEADTIKIVVPYIKSVKGHWYRDLDFPEDGADPCYKMVNYDDAVDSEDAELKKSDFVRVYQYNGDDILAQNDKIYIQEIKLQDWIQVREPDIDKEASAKIKRILLGTKDGENNKDENCMFPIYDGSKLTEGQEREKSYIIKEVEYKESNEENANTRFEMNTKMFQYAFAILESAHTQDAEYVLRDLKELFKEFDIEVEDTESKVETDESKIQPFTWLIPEYKPIVWDPLFNAGETMMIIQSAENGIRGFEEGQEVVMPVKGRISKVLDAGNGKSIVKIEITDNRYEEGMSISISGVKFDDSITEGIILNEGDRLGETTKTSISIIMSNKDKTPLKNVDDYIKYEEETEE